MLTEVALAFAPLRAVDTAPKAAAFFRRLGYQIPETALGGGALGAVGSAATDLVAAVQALVQAGDATAAATAAAALVDKLRAGVTALKQLLTAIKAGGGAGIPGIDRLPERLLEFLVLDYADQRRPELHAALHAAGLIDLDPAPAPGEPTAAIRWERLGQVLSEPGRIANDVYRWDSDFDAPLLLARLERLMRAAPMPGGLYPQSDSTMAALGNTTPGRLELRMPLLQKGLTPETYSEFGITFSPAEAAGGKKAGLALLPYITGATAFDFAVCDRGELQFKASTDVRGVGVVLRPPFSAEGLLNLVGAFDASFLVQEAPGQTEERILVGTAGGTRLAVEGLGIRWFVEGTRDALDLGFDGELRAVRLAITAGDGDGFLQTVLRDLNVLVETQVAFGMALRSGFRFRGGAKLAIELGTHFDVGPVKVEGLRFALAPATDRIGLEAGAVLRFGLGPLQAVIDGMGLTTTVRFTPGNLGPADLDVGFLAPKGVGLSLDAGGFTGGGFLSFDAAKGEYAGALELDFQGLVAVKAIGIINTKMPDGRPGFSLLILITSEFTPIQLSFGFTLNGVGGLIGLNRSVAVEAMVEGIRTNAVKSVLFPENIVANITRIISDISRFFPVRQDHFVVGPMAKLGWGTPSIITLEIGLLLDLPDPKVVIVGVLKALMPAEDAPILRLQANFLGVLDFDRGYAFFRADLYDSRLLAYTLTGSMAFLVSWGEAQTFALSVGGFHPDFRDIPAIPALPGAFANMARIGISLLSDDNPRLKIESYFAVTSNTVQFGARVELFASAGGFNVYGFIGYDVLFQFEPFRFVAALSGGIALRRGRSVIAGIHVNAQLSGPTPWDARGKATLGFLFFDVSVGFHVTWGDPPPAIAPATEDLRALLLRELADTRNWRAELPPAHHLHVTVKQIEPPAGAAGPLVIHPAGVLTFSQRSLPLEGYEIQKFGTRRPLAETAFRLSNATAYNAPVGADFQGVREQFAPAHFVELSDSDKLSRRSFDRLPSGFRLGATSDLVVAAPVVRPVVYELSYLRKRRLAFKGLYQLAVRAYDRLVRASSVRQSPLAFQQKQPSPNAPPRVTVAAESFVVANVSDLRAVAATDGPVSFATEAEALQRQRELLAANPSLAGRVQVVSDFEVNVG